MKSTKRLAEERKQIREAVASGTGEIINPVNLQTEREKTDTISCWDKNPSGHQHHKGYTTMLEQSQNTLGCSGSKLFSEANVYPVAV